MINVYKAGGKYSKPSGTNYSVKTINASDKSKFIIDGWVASLDLIEDIEDAEFEEVKAATVTKSKAKVK